MANDDLAPVRAGQWLLPLLTERRINSWNEAAARQPPRNGGTFDPAMEAGEGGVVRVRNTTGGDRDRFAIVGIDDLVLKRDDNEHEFNATRLFDAVEPEWPLHARSWGLLLEPVRNDKIGRCLLFGVSVALVHFEDDDALAGHQYATVKNTEYGYLDSAPCGRAMILFRETAEFGEEGSKNYWCKLWLGAPPPSGMLARTPEDGIPGCEGDDFPYEPGSAKCRVAKWDNLELVDAGWDCTIYNTVPTEIGGEKLIQVKFDEAFRPLQDVEPC